MAYVERGAGPENPSTVLLHLKDLKADNALAALDAIDAGAAQAWVEVEGPRWSSDSPVN